MQWRYVKNANAQIHIPPHFSDDTANFSRASLVCVPFPPALNMSSPEKRRALRYLVGRTKSWGLGPTPANLGGSDDQPNGRCSVVLYTLIGRDIERMQTFNLAAEATGREGPRSVFCSLTNCICTLRTASLLTDVRSADAHVCRILLLRPPRAKVPVIGAVPPPHSQINRCGGASEFHTIRKQHSNQQLILELRAAFCNFGQTLAP